MSASLAAVADSKGVPAARATGSRLAPLWVVVVFSNLPIYVGLFVFPRLVPLHWLLVLFALTAITLSFQDRGASDRAPVFLAALLCYACVCLVWYVAKGGGDPLVLRERLLCIGVCGASYLAFAASPAALLAARRALAYMVVGCVAMNAWDITHPFMLVPADSEFATVGRAAGFFINPNQSGAALVIGFVLSVSVVPARWRFVYVTAVMIGVALTLSRAALIGLTLVLALLAWRGRTLSWRQIGAALIVVGAMTWIGWLIVSAELEDRYHIDPQMALDRIGWILDPGGRSDFSQDERFELLTRGWSQFLASPIVGNGVGSTELWEARSSTHNMYVMLASDFGVIGLLILPVIVLAAMGPQAGTLSDAAVAGLFMLFWGLFSHNVLGEYYLVMSLGLTAALSRAVGETRPADSRVTTAAAAPGPAAARQ